MPRTGVDLACAVGTALVAPANGVVRHVGPMDGFGILVIIEHGGGYATVMSPLDPERVLVTPGQAVLRGDTIGRTGPPPETGEAAFLHLELRRHDKAIKPDRLYK
jgi:murein DD-endopeptidase MepM/ murein hydrolase activator NlpD